MINKLKNMEGYTENYPFRLAHIAFSNTHPVNHDTKRHPN